ncbi:inner nuclear membrane protein Man1-like [Rhopilema esculentum]|uniref:inner nuclear membrane protein Man1-like n=1 Tax=Rhopilema esculentum TaxID=499914 RepID=UPI0031D31AD8
MADEGDSLSNAELREQLMYYGVKHGPITATTKALLLKKLNEAKSGGRRSSPKVDKVKKRRSIATSNPSQQRTKLAGFSKEEDEIVIKKSQVCRIDSNDSNNSEEKVTVTRRRNSFDLEEEHDIVQKRKTKTDQRQSPASSSSSNSTIGNASLTARLQGKPKGQYQAARDQTDSIAEESTKEDNIDNGRDDEELELAFASNNNLMKSWRGPVFMIFVIVLLICLVGSYASLWSNRMSEWPALPEIKDGSTFGKVSREEVFKMLQCLHEKLSLYAGEKECGYSNVTVELNGGQLGPFFSSECSYLLEEKLIDYEHLSSQVVNFAVDKMYSQFFRVVYERGTMGEITIETLSMVTLSSKTAVKPLICRLKQASQMLTKYILGIVLGFGLLLAAYYVMKRRWMMDDEDTRLMFVYVERIIESLRRHHEACEHDRELPPYLPIPHVRDMLIPPRERKQKSRAWKKAVDFLSSTDARIRVETQRIAGEDFEVWRWIGVMPSDKHVSGASNHLGPEVERGKFWQGQAFDKLEKVVRMPIITPTPCLKIRYLHGGPVEKEEGWERHVRDALLEKCNDGGARILHVYVDVKSSEGCVYVKCDSLESAGKAFRSVYGNWFDGRLVIVKFVTLARYHQRFPDALTRIRPLNVSGDFPSSLSWKSQNDEPETWISRS